EFIRKMLDKNEKTRMSSDQTLKHQWVAGQGARDDRADELRGVSSPEEPEDSTNNADMAEANVNDGIKERRQELIKRLNKEH
ncbi:unnamed protein product, partial [Polarella glacialis]